MRTVGTVGKYRRRCETCSPSRAAAAEVDLDELLTAPTATPEHRRVLSRVAELSEAAAWPPKVVDGILIALNRLLNERAEDQRVRLSNVQVALPVAVRHKLVKTVLDEYDLVEDDTVPSILAWIERKSGELPDGFRDEVRAWLLELHAGSERSKPRSRSSLYAYFGRARPHLISWASRYQNLREVTEQDVVNVLDSQRGHDRQGTFTSLRSLFGFAHRHRLVFADPTRRVHVGAAPKRSTMPMTEQDIAAVKRAAVTVVQRLTVALVAIYAARAAAVRRLTIDDVDLSRRRIRIDGAVRPMPELVYQLMREWLKERHRIWPHTRNRHILLSHATAVSAEPVSDYYLSWHLSMQDVDLEHLRADRILHEAIAVDADPLHLVAAFNLCMQTATDYSEVARNLAARPIENQVPDLDR